MPVRIPSGHGAHISMGATNDEIAKKLGGAELLKGFHDANGVTGGDSWTTFYAAQVGHSGNLGDLMNEYWTAQNSFNPLTSITWHRVSWAGDPDWSNPGDGNPVSSWRDASGNDSHWTATGSTRPLYRASVAGLGNRPALDADGINDYMVGAPTPSATFSIVLIGNSSASTGVTLIDSDNPNRAALAADTNWKMNAATTGDTTVAADTNYHLFVCVFADDTYAKFSLDGATPVTGINAGATSPTTATLFANFGPGAYNGGYMAFVGYYNGDFTQDAKYTNFKSWVGTHYGLTIA